MSEQSDNEIDAMAIGLSWMKDSSLEKWFPITAEQIAQLTKERDQLAAQLKELSGHIRCIYCNAKYTAEQSGELADHILSCEKSPLVQTLKEMDSRIIDRMDMVSDEFERILAITDNQEIIGICERAQQVIEQKEPVIKQRDDALDKLRLSESQLAQLLDENNSLKLDCSHSEAENAQLAAKCAEMRDILTDIEMCNEEYERVCPGCHEPIMDADENILETEHSPTCRFVHALSDQCGVGWLSPEKKKALVGVVEEVLAEHSATMREVSEIGHSEGLCLKPSLYLKVKQALEAVR